MNLVVFPLKHENPFPIKVSTGSVSKINDHLMLLCSGMGSVGVKNLEKALSENPEIDSVYEFGSAASVSKGVVGKIYECTAFYDVNGRLIASSHGFTDLPAAAVTGDDRLYTGCGYEWADTLERPLLYTMETLRFRDTTVKFKKNFFSIRLVSDYGDGDIRKQVAEELGKAKKQIREIFSAFDKISV